MGSTPNSLADRAGGGGGPAGGRGARGLASGFVRSTAGVIGLGFLAVMFLACVATLPWTLRQVREPGYAANPDRATQPAYDAQNRAALRLPPSWAAATPAQAERREQVARDAAERRLADAQGVTIETLRLVAEVRAASKGDAAAAEQGLAEIVPKAPELVAGGAGAGGPGGLGGVSPLTRLRELRFQPTPDEVREAAPFYLLGTDGAGRDVLLRVLVGGGISLAIGVAAAALSVCLGVLYGALSGYAGGWLDGLMMRVVDVMYGLPYVLLVVLLAVAVQGFSDRWELRSGLEREAARWAWMAERLGVEAPPAGPMIADAEGLAGAGKLSPGELAAWESNAAGVKKVRAALEALPPAEAEALRTGAEAANPDGWTQGRKRLINVVTLLVAIGGVAWLTMARVIRGQVLSLKAQPFVEAARAIGVGPAGVFGRHLLPNLVGPITVYATLTVPQAILQESFLSFLGIGVRAPLPSWGNLAADGLGELNLVQSNWWLLLFPCLLLGLTLLALNFVGEGLREALDPKRRAR